VTEFLQAPDNVGEYVAGTVKIAPSSLKKVVDLRLLILLLQQASGLKVVIAAQLYKSNSEDLQVSMEVFGREASPPLREHIRLACDKVKVKSRESKEPKLQLEVVADHWESWMNHEAFYCERCHWDEHFCKDSWQAKERIHEMDLRYPDDEGSSMWSRDCLKALVSIERAGENEYLQSWMSNRVWLHNTIRNHSFYRNW